MHVKALLKKYFVRISFYFVSLFIVSVCLLVLFMFWILMFKCFHFFNLSLCFLCANNQSVSLTIPLSPVPSQHSALVSPLTLQPFSISSACFPPLISRALQILTPQSCHLLVLLCVFWKQTFAATLAFFWFKPPATATP